MEKTTGYLKHAWADLTSDESWWQPIVLLALVGFIPIIGQLFATGYMLDWAREGAWGMSRSFTHKVGDAGKRLKWGFFGVVIVLVWILPLSIVVSILSIIPVIGMLILAFGCIAMLGAGAIATVGCVNMTIYDQIKAGLQFKRLVNMAKMDVNGLARCFCITFLSIIPALIYSALCGTASIPFMSQLSAMDTTGSVVLSYGLLGSGSIAAVVGSALYLVLQFCNTLIQTLMYRAYGYWVGQFKPAKWGGIDQPMPFEPGYTERAAAAPTTNDEQPAGYADVKEQVAGAAATAGAFVKETAEKAADAVNDAAAGFKTEQPQAEGDEPQVIEAEVISVDDVEPQAEAPAEEVEEAPAEEAAAEPQQAAKVAYCSNCGAPVEEHHSFCVNCGNKL